MRNYNLPHPQSRRKEFNPRPIGKRSGYVISIFLIIMGAFCIAFTDLAYAILPYALGILMTITGAFAILESIRSREYQTNDTKLTSMGIIILALGIAILRHVDEADTLIGAIWGMFGIFKGSEELNDAIFFISQKKPFAKELIHSALELIVALILLLDPVEKIWTHVIILGIELCLLGIQFINELHKHEKNQDGKESYNPEG